MNISKEQILSLLEQIIDPDSGENIVARGMISGVVIKGSEIGLALEMPQDMAMKAAPLRQRIETLLGGIAGVSKVSVVITAHSEEKKPAIEAKWKSQPIDGVKKIIAVASGKGGVGKSTMTICLAKALADSGKRVGVLDADIYGPSIPRITAHYAQPEYINGKMQPFVKDGIKFNSFGYVAGDAALVWRGPMIGKALTQLLHGTNWGELDILLVDMPPGTGDVHLSMMQQVPLFGAVIITMPQQLSVVDADRCCQMFLKAAVPLLGVIENMSYLENGGEKTAIFGEGGGMMLAKKYNIPLLAQIPLMPKLAYEMDNGIINPIEVFSGIISALEAL